MTDDKIHSRESGRHSDGNETDENSLGESLAHTDADAWVTGLPPRVRRSRRAARRPPGPRPPASDVEVAPGRIAIAQGQVYITGALLIVQLFLITTALYELLSGQPQTLWGIAGASLLAFIVALVVAIWPRRVRDGF